MLRWNVTFAFLQQSVVFSSINSVHVLLDIFFNLIATFCQLIPFNTVNFCVHRSNIEKCSNSNDDYNPREIGVGCCAAPRARPPTMELTQNVVIKTFLDLF